MSKIGNKKINSLENPEQYKVGTYVRTGAKIDGIDVVKFQKDRVEEYCIDLNLKIANWYIDEGFDNFAEVRPSYDKLIQDIKDGKINMIVTANLPRIARSKKEMLDLLKLQKEYNFRTILSDSREELYKDRSAIDFKHYLDEDTELENAEDEEYTGENDMEV